jgi:hypothetical protein
MLNKNNSKKINFLHKDLIISTIELFIMNNLIDLFDDVVEFIINIIIKNKKRCNINLLNYKYNYYNSVKIIFKLIFLYLVLKKSFKYLDN